VSAFDVAIIGGGLIGACAAFELSARKLRVMVVDRQQPGREASWAAAGMLAPAPAGPEALPLVPLAKESLRIYPDLILAVEEASGKSTAFAREGTLEIFFVPDGEAARDALVAEHRRLGLSAETISP
jgi:glycine oxidase